MVRAMTNAGMQPGACGDATRCVRGCNAVGARTQRGARVGLGKRERRVGLGMRLRRVGLGKRETRVGLGKR